jgi:hypothetical protein
LERYTSGSADRTSASAALLDRRLQGREEGCDDQGEDQKIGEVGRSGARGGQSLMIANGQAVGFTPSGRVA